METTIYRLPCSMTGLDAEVDNCDPRAIIVAVKADDPMSAGCVDRYLTTDGQLIDCSIDSVDFAQWFELEELEELEESEDDGCSERACRTAEKTNMEVKMEQVNAQFIPVVLEEDDWIIKTAGYQQSCYHAEKARNGFYVVSGRKPDGVDYVHPNIYSYDMTGLNPLKRVKFISMGFI